jgi:hypothetical protein
MPEKKQEFILVSFTHPFAGAQQTRCDLKECGRVIYEHPKNLERIREKEGTVICIECAIKIRKEVGSNFTFRGQLWNGEFREPQPTEQTAPLLEWFNRKQ